MVDKSLSDKLNKAQQKLSLHIDKSPLAVIDWDKDFCVTDWNPAAERIFGYTAQEAIGQHASFIIPELHREQVDQVWTELLKKDGGNRSTNKNITKYGKIISCEWYNTPITDEMGNVLTVSSLAQDVSEQVLYLKALQYQTHHDSLTKLHNREWLINQIEKNIDGKPGQPFNLFFIDLDRFKEINDTLGHDIGDEMLIILSKRLKEYQKENCTLARLGGDEFAILTTNTEILKIVNAVLSLLQEPVKLSDVILEVGASIGLASYPLHGSDAASLMRCAEIAMYKSKITNNRYIEYSKNIDNHSPDRLNLINDLRSAIKTNQLVLYFQPKVDIREHMHIGYEALIRWQHPQRGLIFPDEFIPYAEITDLIQPLTLWVIENAIIQSVQWSKKGLDFNVSVNLSTRNLLDTNLPNQIAALLKTYDIEPSSIELEITESAVMTEPEITLKNLKTLHQLGILISIDDFGTGYSSLSYLRQMPIHKLKIDRTFVMHMDSNEEDRIIVESTINLAHNLGLKVVAEGIESQAILTMLNSLDCDEAQGYYISKPLPAEHFKGWTFK